MNGCMDVHVCVCVMYLQILLHCRCHHRRLARLAPHSLTPPPRLMLWEMSRVIQGDRGLFSTPCPVPLTLVVGNLGFQCCQGS